MLDVAEIHDHDVEQDLLACILAGRDPRLYDVTADDFDQPAHAAVWQAACRVADTGGTPDPATIRLALGADGDKAAVWLLDLYARPVASGNGPAFAAAIRRAADLRRLATLSRQIMQAVTADDADPATITDRIRHAIDQPTGTLRTTQTFADSIPDVLDQIQSGQQAGRSTPWPDLDRLIHGLADSRLYVVGARPGVGKSLLAQNLAMHWSDHHRLPTYFASLEMSLPELTTRAIAQTGQVGLSALMSGHTTPADDTRIDSAAARLMESQIRICDDPSQTLDTIRAGARDLQRRHGLGLVAVDYLQLVTPRDRRMPREQQVSEVSRGLKLLAKELAVPVVALSQLRRLPDGEKNRRPTLSDLRESGAIEQDADVVMLLHLPDPEVPDRGEISVAKARAGRRDTVDVVMRTHYATISPAATPWQRQ